MLPGTADLHQTIDAPIKETREEWLERQRSRVNALDG